MSFGMGNLLVPTWSTFLFESVNAPNAALSGFFNSIIIILSTPCKFPIAITIHPFLSTDLARLSLRSPPISSLVSDPTSSSFTLAVVAQRVRSTDSVFLVLIAGLVAVILNAIIPEEAPEANPISSVSPSYDDPALEDGPTLGKNEKAQNYDDEDYKARVEPVNGNRVKTTVLEAD